MSVRTPPDSYTRARSGRTLPAFMLERYEVALFATQAKIRELERQLDFARDSTTYARYGIRLEAEVSERISDERRKLNAIIDLLRDERP